MVTIKEVAKKAGVSHGTVSNVINGAMNVSVDKIQRVEKAMFELGYKPNVIARSLKAERTYGVNLVLPNIQNHEYIELFENIDRYMKKEGFRVNLKLTNEIPTEERRILNESLMHNVDGVILLTCQPDNEGFFDRVIKNGLKIVFIHREAMGEKYNFVGLDVKKIIGQTAAKYLQQGKRKIAVVTGPKEYSFEADILNSYFSALCEARVSVEPNYIEMTDFSCEGAFRAAMRLLNLPDIPEVIMCSNNWMANGVEKAVAMVFGSSANDPVIAVLQPYDWMKRGGDHDIVLPFYRLAAGAFEMLMEIIKTDSKYPRRYIIKAELIGKMLTDDDSGLKVGEEQTVLRILLNKSPSSEAVKCLLPDFERRTGIHVTVREEPYAELFNTIWHDKKALQYDIVSIDLPWLYDMVADGTLRCLNDLYESGKQFFSSFEDDTLEKFSKVEGDNYGVPYSLATQLLFYRRDLFAKLQHQRQYFEWYKEELTVPKTWQDFNKVAKFFTKQYNPLSETKYGVTLGGRSSSGSVCEFLPRLFGHGGQVFDETGAALHQNAAIQALENYCESFLYADPRAVDWWWNEQTEEYCKGNAAMMILFTEHIVALEDRSFSKVVGKTDSAILPGKYSLLGGWSLGVLAESGHVAESYEFLKWISSREMLGPSAALGRVVPRRDDEYKASMERTYPWFETACAAYNFLQPRVVPRVGGKRVLTEPKMEEIIGTAVHDAITGKTATGRALEKAGATMDRMMEL